MTGWRGFIGVSVVAAGCAHGVTKNTMRARAAADLTCDASAVRWSAVGGQQAWIAHGCDRQAKYVVSCHYESDNPFRPVSPPFEVCEWSLESVRRDVPPPPGNQPASTAQ